MTKMFTTLRQIRDWSPCSEGWTKLLRNLGGMQNYGLDTPLTFKQIYDSNGYHDTLWCLRTIDKKFHLQIRDFAVKRVEKIEHSIKSRHAFNALDVARKYVKGEATKQELLTAHHKINDFLREQDYSISLYPFSYIAGGIPDLDCAVYDSRGKGVENNTSEDQMKLLFKYCRRPSTKLIKKEA